MRPLTLILPALLALAGTPTLAVPAHVAGVAFAADYAALVAEYDAEVAAWKASIKAADDAATRKELRRAPPAIAFWPRFQELGRGGEGRALLWMVDHVRDTGVKSKERGPVLEPLYAELIKAHANQEWFAGVVAQLTRDARYIGDAKVVGMLVQIADASKSSDVSAQALFMAAKKLSESTEEGAQERSKALLARITESYSHTDWATLVRASTITDEQVQAGATAPDFGASTIDGFKFKLSDYRGKVVLLDFYGFW